MPVIYLHGFASSPGSKKANFFCERLRAQGHPCHIPDLNVPSFERLTLTAMIAKTAQTVSASPAGDVLLIGSSMGGLTALHFMDRHRDDIARRVKHLVLMAPALDFMENRVEQFGETGLQTWQTNGTRPFFHYAHNEERPVHYGLVEDIQQYDSYSVTLDVPVLIFHGKNDASVDYRQSVRYAAKRPSVDLRLLDSDHQLLDQMDAMLFEVESLLKR